MSEWKPISDFTEDDFNLGIEEGRVVLYNSCNGPHHLSDFRDGYVSSDEIKREGVWDLFFVLPPALPQPPESTP